MGYYVDFHVSVEGVEYTARLFPTEEGASTMEVWDKSGNVILMTFGPSLDTSERQIREIIAAELQEPTR